MPLVDLQLCHGLSRQMIAELNLCYLNGLLYRQNAGGIGIERSLTATLSQTADYGGDPSKRLDGATGSRMSFAA